MLQKISILYYERDSWVIVHLFGGSMGREVDSRTGVLSICEIVWNSRVNIIRKFFEEEKQILVVDAYFLIKMEWKK